MVAGYEIAALVFVYGFKERFGEAKMTESEFAWRYFLKWSVGFAMIIQVGFVILSSFLYHAQESIAVGLTALVGFPGLCLLAMVAQSGFFRRYKRLPNLIRRLEKMNSFEREKVLSEMPPKLFAQLPGDYRYVTHTKTNR